MATTTYQTAAIEVDAIGDRTDASGAAGDDLAAAELRLPHAFLAEGALTTNAFKVAAQGTPDMTVKVGSGTAKADVYVVEGTATGQGNYVVRLDAATTNVTISASEPAATRTDEIYLVVLDSPYDGNTAGPASAPLSIPRLAYRKGDAGGAAPGPDAVWDAYAKLASITVAAAVTTITTANITDSRPDASFEGRMRTADLSSFGQVGIIAYKVHDPAVAEVYSTSTASAADVDATDLVVAGTLPGSGKVLVTLNAYGAVGDSTVGDKIIWGLREGSTTLNEATMGGEPGTAWRATAMFEVVGVAGAAFSYKWMHRQSVGGAVSTPSVYAGGDWGPATMTVEALP